MIEEEVIGKIIFNLQNSSIDIDGTRLISNSKTIDLNSDKKPVRLISEMLAVYPDKLSASEIGDYFGMDEKRIGGIVSDAKKIFSDFSNDLEVFSIRGKRLYGIKEKVKDVVTDINKIKESDVKEVFKKTDISMNSGYYLVGKDEAPFLRTSLNDAAMLEIMVGYLGQSIKTHSIADFTGRKVSEINHNMNKLLESIGLSECFDLSVISENEIYKLTKVKEVNYSVGPIHPVVEKSYSNYISILNGTGLHLSGDLIFKKKKSEGLDLKPKYSGEIFMHLLEANGRWVEKEYLSKQVGLSIPYVNRRLKEISDFCSKEKGLTLETPYRLGIARLRPE